MSGAFPTLLRVAVCGAEIVPASTLPKLKLDGTKDGTGPIPAPIPTPDNGTLKVRFDGEEEKIVRVPAAAPSPGGVNPMPITQLAPAAKAVPHVPPERLNREEAVKLIPLIDVDPPFVNVSVSVAVEPMGWSPKFKLAGLTFRPGTTSKPPLILNTVPKP